jgi:hypothetical protein
MAGTIIDSLIVQLQLDPSQFEAGQKRAVRSLRELEEGTGRTGRAVEDKLGSGFRAAAGLIGGLDNPLAMLRRHLEVTLAKSSETALQLKKLGEAGGARGSGMGQVLHEGSLLGARGLQVMAGSALVALTAITALGGAIGRLKGTAANIFQEGLLAQQAGLPVQRMSQISAGLHIAGNIPPEESEAWLARIGQIQAAAVAGRPAELLALGAELSKLTKLSGVLVSPMMPPDVMMRQAAAAMARITPQMAAQLGGQIGGMSPAMAEGLRRIGPEFEKVVAASRGFAITPEQAEAAQRFNAELAKVAEQFKTLSRVLLVEWEPAWSGFFRFINEMAEIAQALAEGRITDVPKIEHRYHEEWLRDQERKRRGGADRGAAPGAGAEGEQPDRTGSPLADPAEREAYIRSRATFWGIDPDVAMRVARAEGFDVYAGDHGRSFGAFQLNVEKGSLGDKYFAETGHDPSDPMNEQDMINWTMQHLRETGWGPYHGAARAGVSEWQGIGQAPPPAPAPPSPAIGFAPSLAQLPAPALAPQSYLPAPANWTAMLASIRQGPAPFPAAAASAVDNRSINFSGDVVVNANTNDPYRLAQVVDDQVRRNLRVAFANQGLA